MWAPQLETFSDRYRLVAPDFRGHGGSEPGDGQYTLESLVDDLFAVLDRFAPGEVMGCGLSMGGYVLLRALERAPERFRAVVLADTRSGSDDDATKLGRAEGIRLLKSEGAQSFAEQLVGRLLGRTTLERRPALRETVLDMIRRNSVLGMCGAQLAMAGRTDTTGALRALAVPALVMVGEEDALTPPEQAREMAGAAPGARLQVIPRAGHLSNLESPEEFNRSLAAFLQEVVGG